MSLRRSESEICLVPGPQPEPEARGHQGHPAVAFRLGHGTRAAVTSTRPRARAASASGQPVLLAAVPKTHSRNPHSVSSIPARSLTCGRPGRRPIQRIMRYARCSSYMPWPMPGGAIDMSSMGCSLPSTVGGVW
ncbi:hypothetical protein GY45DRAFT_65000 [Cubamyces sp. BRFM 1775]|nr:hypothetical protein GY45DRAFT_65000 [Cubamyces sp. BRFM 1775]